MPVSTVPDIELSDVLVRRTEAGGARVRVLELAELRIAAGEHLCITGASGAGKTTLIEVLCGLRRPERGRLLVGGRSLFDLGSAALDRWRREAVGIVFQDFHLVPELSIEANILLPLNFSQMRVSHAQRRRALHLMDLMSIGGAKRRAAALSRGEQQRIGIARALLQSPSLVVADEPTASLDAETAEQVFALLMDHVRDTGATLVVVSHDPAVQARADRRLILAAGLVEAVT